MTKPIKIMKKFRVGYSVKWNFNGILEVEAENADDAEKKAEAKLDEMAGNNEFDDVSNFKAEFDGADVLDTEEVKDRASERRYAEYIAALSGDTIDGKEAAKRVADAVVHCKAHPVVCMGDGMISFDYDNSFGPTLTVDDVLEKMNMHDWRVACDEFCKGMLRKGGLDPENFGWPMPLPTVTKVPEDGGTDVVARVCVTFKVDPRTYNHILSVVDKENWSGEDEDEDEDAPATGEEICAHCDAVIRYVAEDGKRVVTCPECGTVNPLCNECDPDTKKCSECKVSEMCEELNRQRADALAEPEEEWRERKSEDSSRSESSARSSPGARETRSSWKHGLPQREPTCRKISR